MAITLLSLSCVAGILIHISISLYELYTYYKEILMSVMLIELKRAQKNRVETTQAGYGECKPSRVEPA